MLPVLTAADVRAADAAAVDAGVPVTTLMARAGWAVSQIARSMLDGAYGRRVVVVCGAGNNAGDGLVAASNLRRAGARVDVVSVLGEPSRGAAADALQRWGRPLHLVDDLDRLLAHADMAVDALFGVGLSRDVDGPAAKAVAKLNDFAGPVLAIDVPSGVDADTGQVRGAAVAADVTVTFGGLKPGLVFMPGRELAGGIHVADIGLPDVPFGISSLDPIDVAEVWPWRSQGDHKRSAGTLLIVAGSRAMPGAAVLTCRAAVRAGAGMVVIAAPDAAASMIVSAVPEITSIPYAGDHLSADASLAILEAAERADALSIGPGLGRDPATLEAVALLLERFNKPAVVDADALLALATVRRSAVTVVTPHAGEWAAILGRDPSEAARDRLSALDDLREHLRSRFEEAVCILKGPGTLIGSDQRTFLDAVADTSLAQAGTGDALTGICGAVLAAAARRGSSSDIDQLMAAAVRVHARAGAIAAGDSEPAGTSLLIEAIPRALEELL